MVDKDGISRPLPVDQKKAGVLGRPLGLGGLNTRNYGPVEPHPGGLGG